MSSPLLTAGTICLAARSHTSSKPNELEFEKGDVVFLIEGPSGDKKYCQATVADGSVGLIPVSAILERPGVMLQPMPWFHGPITRFDAEKILDRNQDGQFLMRTSQSTQGIYALAVSHGGKVNHYLVAMDFSTRKLTITGQRYFTTLLELVDYYTEHGEDLGTCLRVPRIRRGVLEYYVDADTLKSKWGLSESHISEHEQSIGRGEFGEVKTGTYRNTQVAIKKIHEDKQSGTAVTALLREAAVMTHLHHQNLVQLVGLVFKGSALQYIVMEVMGKGSLQKYLISRGRSVVSQVELLSFGRDVCAGMEYISSQMFVHRDLAARNVLLNSNGKAKISDFGMAQRVDVHVPHEGGKFPIKWTAPEALKDSKFSSKSDVWSFGVFLWELLSFGRTPYPSIPADDVLESIEDGNLMDPPEGCPKGVYDIMCGCWEMEPKERPSFSLLQQLLSKSFGESTTPHSSPMPVRKMVTLPQIDELLCSPVAAQTYRDAPLTRKANMFVSNLTFLGPLASGKTSLLRNLQGQAFRLTEPHTLNISFSESYLSLVDHLDWQPSSAALMYEDELTRIIIDELLKHTKNLASGGAVGGASGLETGIGMGMGKGVQMRQKPPPLPAVPVRRRSQSFTDMYAQPRSPDLESTKASYRMSGSFEVLESETPEGKLQMGFRPGFGAVGSHEGHHHHGRHGNRKSFISRLFASKPRGKVGVGVRRHHSDAVKRTQHTGFQPKTNGSVVKTSLASKSSLPERLVEKIRDGMKDCTGSSLPLKYFGRFVDMPGAKAFQTARSLFITDYSVCVLVYDTSKSLQSAVSPSPRRKASTASLKSESKSGLELPFEDSYFDQIMADFDNLGLHWSHSDADMTLRGQRVILVATHSDKVPSSVSHANFDRLRSAIKASPYHKYVAMMKYVLSSSSVIERANMEDLKRFIIETVKKSCRQQVPLKWLRCIRRFLGLSEKGIYFITLEDARKIVSDMCDLSQREEIDAVIRFLHHNHIVLHYSRVHQLCDVVFTSPAWFAQHLGGVFGAAWTELAPNAPARVQMDQNRLQTQGILSCQLLDYVWREHNQPREKLLAVLHKMDLVCCLDSNSQPIAPSASPADIAQDITSESVTRSGEYVPPFSVSSLVVPCVVTEPLPLHLSRMPPFDLDPLHFRFKNGFVPYGVFPRLVTRCVHSYPSRYLLFSNAAIFEVDASTVLLLLEGKGRITVSLHQGRQSSSGSPLGFAPTNLDEVNDHPEPPNLDTCMVVQMFLQAAISDIIQQWLPQVDYDMCVQCSCSKPARKEAEGKEREKKGEKEGEKKGEKEGEKEEERDTEEPHYVVLSQTDDVLQRVSLDCERGSQITIGVTLYSWFGEIPHPHSPEEDSDYITSEDIEVVCFQLGSSWPVLGQTLGFSHTELERVAMVSKTHLSAAHKMLEEWKTLYKQNATFFALLGALEIIQRRDLADDLVASRMHGVGINL